MLPLIWAMTVSSAWPVHGQIKAPIARDQIDAKAGVDYKGLAVTPTRDGAKLRCVFQKMEGEVTPGRLAADFDCRQHGE
jgi:hypothetical protein